MRITTMLIGFAMAFKDQNDLDSIINSLMGLKLAHADGKEEYPAVLLFHEERPLSAFGPKASETIANAIVEGDKAISDSLRVAAKRQDAEKAAAVESNFPKPIMCTAHPKKPASGYYEQSNETPHNPEHDVFVCPGCAEKAVAEGKKVQGILKKLQEQVKNMPSPIAPGAKKISTLVQVMDPKTKKPTGSICRIQTIREGKLHLMDPNGAVSVVDPRKVLIVGEQLEIGGENKPPMITLYKEPIKPDLERWKMAEENLAKKRTQLESQVEEKLEKELEKEGEAIEPKPRKLSQEEIAAASKRAIQVGDIVQEKLDILDGQPGGPRFRVTEVGGKVNGLDIVHTVFIESDLKGTKHTFDPKSLVVVEAVKHEPKSGALGMTKAEVEELASGKKSIEVGDLVQQFKKLPNDGRELFGPQCQVVKIVEGPPMEIHAMHMTGGLKGTEEIFAPETLAVVGIQVPAVEDPATKDVPKKATAIQRVSEHGVKPGDLVQKMTKEHGGTGFGHPCKVDKVEGTKVHATFTDGPDKGKAQVFRAGDLILYVEASTLPASDKAIE